MTEISQMEKVKLSNNISIDVVRGSDFILKEIWEENIYNIDYNIKNNDVVFDIGANQGIFSIYAASKGAIVHSCEPVPSNYKILVQNIDNNSMFDRINPINFAISSIEEDVILQLPNAKEICPTGMGSISQESINHLKENINFNTIDISVKTKKLGDWISSSKVNKIDLMKIDCEGAEVDILKSISFNDAQKIKNLVMETHRGYDEKDLVNILNQLGFIITRYKPVSGLYGGGALFATRNTNAIVVNQIVCDVKNAPKHVFCDDQFSIDASLSFLIEDTNIPLSYKWYYNNMIISESDILNFKFNDPGIKEIQLKISSKNIDEFHNLIIWAFSKNEILTDNVIPITKSETKFHSISKNSYIISKDNFPKGWDMNSIQLSFELQDWKEGTLGYVFHNGIRYPFESPSIEISLKHYPNNKDIKFSVILFESNLIRIGWWADRNQYDETIVKKYVVGVINSYDKIPLGNEAIFDGSSSFCTGKETPLNFKWNKDSKNTSNKFIWTPTECGNFTIRLDIENEGETFTCFKNVYVYNPNFKFQNTIKLSNEISHKTECKKMQTLFYIFSSDVQFWEGSGIKLEIFCHDFKGPLGWFKFEEKVIPIFGGVNTFELPINYIDNKNTFAISVIEDVVIDVVAWNINKQINVFKKSSDLLSLFYCPDIVYTDEGHNLDCSNPCQTGSNSNIKVAWIINNKIKSDKKNFTYQFDSPGKHVIELELKDGNITSTSKKSILALPTFSQEYQHTILDKDGFSGIIKKETVIVIPKVIFPSDWNPNKITFQFSTQYPPISGILKWFNNTIEISGYFQQVELDLFNDIKDVDYKLLCMIEEDCPINISYWFS